MDSTIAVMWAQVGAGIATALATVALVFYTWRLAQRTSQPHVVATIEPNIWSIRHLDIVVANTGNAVAYAIEVKFSPPPLEQPEGEGFPLKSVSVLKPGQQVKSYLGEYRQLTGKVFTVTVTWRHSHAAKCSETNEYPFDMSQYEGMTFLGPSSPIVQIADEVKHLREDWRWVASGSRRIAVDEYNSEDRATERRLRTERYKELRNEHSDGAAPVVPEDPENTTGTENTAVDSADPAGQRGAGTKDEPPVSSSPGSSEPE